MLHKTAVCATAGSLQVLPASSHSQQTCTLVYLAALNGPRMRVWRAGPLFWPMMRWQLTLEVADRHPAIHSGNPECGRSSDSTWQNGYATNFQTNPGVSRPPRLLTTWNVYVPPAQKHSKICLISTGDQVLLARCSEGTVSWMLHGFPYPHTAAHANREPSVLERRGPLVETSCWWQEVGPPRIMAAD